MIGIRSAFSIRARGHRPHLEAVYMTAPRSICRNTKKALPTGGRPYMTVVGLGERALTAQRFTAKTAVIARRAGATQYAAEFEIQFHPPQQYWMLRLAEHDGRRFCR